MHESRGAAHIFKAKLIRGDIQAAIARLRARKPWLAHQNAIGFIIFLLSAGGLVANAWTYGTGKSPAWLVILVAAFLMSILHELEHDLIHRLYFRDRPFVYGVMMIGVWLLRPSTINPWIRREWHLHHHRASGTESDLEERTLSNGEPWSVRRLLMITDSLLGYVLRPRTAREMLLTYAAAQGRENLRAGIMRVRLRNALSVVPVTLAYYVLWYSCVLEHARSWLGLPPSAMSAWLPTLDFLAITLFIPGVVRNMCLNFVSSNIHYYGDIETRNTLQQTQVWTSWWVWPLQLFCFNFGGTHAIHHFVVQEPFYVRQLIAHEAQRVMRRNGVRFNDFATLLRANRWARTTARV